MFELIPERSSTFEVETLYHIYVSKEKIFLVIFVEVASGLLQNDHNYGNPSCKRPIG